MRAEADGVGEDPQGERLREGLEGVVRRRVRPPPRCPRCPGMTLLTADRPPTAVMTGADVAALGVYRAAHELGLRIPRDLSLVGYNNTALAALAPVQLTSVDQAGHTMGSAAARMLVERVESRRDRPMQTTMTPRLVVRPPPARARAPGG
ncbi:HTH-type transcriptional repressor PurR [Streptomyces tendae]